MAKNSKITEEQFNQIVQVLHNILFPPENVQRPGPPVPTDCEALLAFITAAQAIYTRDCPGP